MRTTIRGSALAALSVALLITTGCAPRDEADDTATDSGASPTAGDCEKDDLDTYSEGVLTVATDNPAYPPWFVDNDPSNGKGYESAVAYAIADQLGFAEDEVEWVKVPFNAVVSPGEKEFDFDVNQVSITPQRAKAVDFSSGYYDVRQAVVTTKGSSIEGVTSMAELQDARLGAQVGTTSYAAIGDQIQTSEEGAPFDTNDQAVQALENGQIDGIVVDLPTAYYMVAVQLSKGSIVGQLPLPDGEVEQFGAVLDLGSPLTDCVSQAVDTLRDDGTLAELEDQWLAQQGAPELS
ncbi:ABC transporter substrate-binding protein [Nocardioides sp. GXQ0305]|uniref:ABC transporter substrate-binding protein n=1 Tax=Nocardioides sp. GXQ0305 TaxID=3423912 RepID=UPI003D7CF745